MRSIGLGVFEIRIRTQLEHRIIYLTRFSEGIYVLHAFEKRSSRTLGADVSLARTRLKELIDKRRREGAH
jgi:phage-related protein